MEHKTALASGSFADGQVVSLRLNGVLAGGGGEMQIHAQAVVRFSHIPDLVIGSKQTTTMKDVLQLINNAWDNYSEIQKQAVQTLCGKYAVTENWGLNNILGNS